MAADAIKPEKILYTLLKTADATVPVFHTVLPDGQSPPCISFQRIATRYDDVLNGSRSQFTVITFRVDVWANTDEEAGTISTKIHGVLDGLKQGVAEGVALVIMATNEFSIFEEEEKIHRRNLTFQMMIRDFTS